MSNINTVTLSGNAVADPELRHTPSGFPIANLRLAVNESKKQEDGSYEEQAHFFDITVLGKFGELVARKVRKGDRVSVAGKLEQQRWQTPEGDNRSKVVVLARDLDSSALFKKDEDIAPSTASNGSAPAASGEQLAAAADDDIPF